MPEIDGETLVDVYRQGEHKGTFHLDHVVEDYGVSKEFRAYAIRRLHLLGRVMVSFLEDNALRSVLVKLSRT